MPDHNTITAEFAGAEARPVREGRAPGKWIKVLGPVWGYELTQQFLNVSLPTCWPQATFLPWPRPFPPSSSFQTGRWDEPMIRESAG
jgi:hypothetical protein